MTTTLRKLINSIDKTNTRLQTNPDWEELCQELNISNFYWSDDTRLKGYWIKVWLCTDTWVGVAAYFLDDEFVFITDQSARKASTNYNFVSLPAADKVRQYILSLISEEDSRPKVSIIDDASLDEELPDTYTLEYNEQILHKHALLDGKEVEIVNKRFAMESGEKFGDDYFHATEVIAGGKKIKVDCRDLQLKFNTLQ